MVGRLLLIGFILLLVVLIIWMLFKIYDGSKNYSIKHNSGYMQRHIENDDIVLHTQANHEPKSVDIGVFVAERIAENIIETSTQIINNDMDELSGENYYDTIQRNNHANDTQNVHDSMVIKELKRRYDRLIELNQKAVIVPSELQEQLTQDEYAEMFCQTMFIELSNYCQAYFDPVNSFEKLQKAQKVIETVRKGSIFTGFVDEIKEDWILAHVWYRIHSIDNVANRDQLLNALMDQLQDAGKYALTGGIGAIVAAVINGIAPPLRQELTTECTTGRIGRYFQTFTLLDADPLLQQPILDEKEYENEAYTKSYKILTKFIDSNPGMDVLYHTTNEDVLSENDKIKLNEMKKGARDAIAEAITKDYDGIISRDKLDILIEKCMDGV